MKFLKFDAPKYRLCLLFALLAMNGCILTEDSPSERGSADIGADTNDPGDVQWDIADTDTPPDAAQVDGGTDADGDTDADGGADADDGGLGCDWQASPRDCLEAALFENAYATLVNTTGDTNSPPADPPKVGAAIIMQFEAATNATGCRVKIEFETRQTVPCAVGTNRTVTVFPGNNQPSYQFSAQVSEHGIVRLLTEDIDDIGSLVFQLVPEDSVRRSLRTQIEGKWIESATTSSDEDRWLAGTEFRAGIAEESSYGGYVGVGLSRNYIAIIRGTVDIIRCASDFCWILRDAEYAIDEPNCNLDCYEAGQGVTPLGGVIHVNEPVSGVILPKFDDDDTIRPVEGVRVREP